MSYNSNEINMSLMRKILWIQKIMKRLTISSEIYKISFESIFDGVWKKQQLIYMAHDCLYSCLHFVFPAKKSAVNSNLTIAVCWNEESTK